MDNLNKYLTQNKVFETLIAGRNLMEKNPGDTQTFDCFFEYLLSLASKGSNTDEKLTYLSYASDILDKYSESTEINDSIMNYIITKKAEYEKEYKKVIDDRIQENDKALNLIERLVDAINDNISLSEFEYKTNQIHALDELIKIDVLTDVQKKRYGLLTEKCSLVITNYKAMQEKRKLIDYNIRAVETYRKIFDLFKNRNSKTSAQDVAQMFTFDETKLTPETIVYYNYVYSYIFSKLNDNEKFELTKYSIKIKMG